MVRERFPGGSRGLIHDTVQLYVTNAKLACYGDHLHLSRFVHTRNGLPLSQREKATVVEALIAAADTVGAAERSVRRIIQFLDGN